MSNGLMALIRRLRFGSGSARAALGVVLVCTVATLPAAAQAGGIPSPSEYHGYDLSSRYSVTSKVTDYYRVLAEQSPRVAYEEYGQSIHGRPLPMIFIGSEENVRNRDAIRVRTRQLTGVTEPLPEAELRQLIAETPAMAWLFIVDTDEQAGVQVLQELAHALATRDDPVARAVRENVLVVLTPMTNPDSHARYVNWHMIYDVEGASVDPNAIENRAHWGIHTDGNAWGLDVNRDFGFFATPEMAAFANTVAYWRPQLLLDVHSGPNTLFIPPFPRPYHPMWSPQAPKWWGLVAEQANDWFGERGWTFYSREGYEGVTSVSFGLSWAMLGPGVSSFLYESYGGRPGKTIAFRRTDGTIATMRMSMDRHEVAIWALLNVAAEGRTDLLRDAHDIVVSAVRDARRGPIRAVAIPIDGPNADSDKIERMVERLVLQGVEVRQTVAPFTTRARPFRDMTTTSRREFAASTYVIDFAQPQARLARALLDPTIDYSDPEVDVPFGRSMPYYDVAWGNLPLIFGVDAFALAEPVRAGTRPVDGYGEMRGSLVTKPGARDRFAFGSGSGGAALGQGGQVGQGGQQGGVIRRVDRAAPPFAYVLPSGREASYRVAIRMMADGYNVRVNRSSFQLDGRVFAKGSFTLLHARNPEGVRDRLHTLVREQDAELVEVAGPLTEAGLTFGSDGGLAAIPQPLIAVVADDPVRQQDEFGGIRSVLQGDFGLTFTPVMLETINRGNLSSYTAVVLPHAGMAIRAGPGFSAGYDGVLDVENLRRYVRGGGTLVAVKGAAAFLARDPVLGADVAFDGWAEHTGGAVLRAVWSVDNPMLDGARTAVFRPGLREVGLPLLAAGYAEPEFAAPGAFPVLLRAEDSGPARVIARFHDDPATLKLDGYMLSADREMLAGRPFAIVQPVGRGRVIFLADDPTFRGYWYGLNQLFLNALLFGPIL
jgi:hypothetical protein